MVCVLRLPATSQGVGDLTSILVILVTRLEACFRVHSTELWGAQVTQETLHRTEKAPYRALNKTGKE